MPESLPAQLERALIEGIHENPDAFRVLYRHYLPRIYAYLAYRVGTRQDAEDLTAGVFVTVVEHIKGFEYRGDGSFAAWIFRIAHNDLMRFYRSERRYQENVQLDDLPEIDAPEHTPDEMFSRKEQFARLYAMIGSLSARKQEIITLRFFGGLRNQEIAAVLGLDERTVASHLARGLDDLQQKYGLEDLQR